MHIDKELLKNGVVSIDGKVLPQYNNGNGYLFVSIPGFKAYVHRIVALEFIPNPDNKPQVNHKDGVKSNNNLSNLEWCTPRENGKHAYKNGLNYISDLQKKRTAEATQGSKSHMAVLTELDIPIIRKLKQSGLTNKIIAERYNCNRETIGYIIRGKTWKHVL